MPDKADAKWLTKRMPRVFSIEGLYGEPMREVCAANGTRVVLQANPELYRPDDLVDVNLEVVLPTPWEADRFPAGTRVLPVPVNTADLYPVTRPDDGPVRLFHPAGAAMQDRNGTRSVLSAVRTMRMPCTVGIANRPDLPRRRMGRTNLVPLPDQPTYLEHWSPEARPDVVVLPRRYGGLCLPLQEAASCGVAIVTSDLEPQRSWVPAPGLVPVRRGPAKVSMKGGTFDVHSVDAAALTDTLDRFVRDLGLRAEAGLLAREHAEAISWDRLLDDYLEILDG